MIGGNISIQKQPSVSETACLVEGTTLMPHTTLAKMTPAVQVTKSTQ